MSPYSEHDIYANGILIHYYRSTPPGGGALPLIMLHGLTDNGMCWVRVADALGDTYDVILPDTRGHGYSEKPASGYSLEERAADIAGLIDALDIERPVLFGHSLGGQTATAVAALYPDKVRAVILEDPAWFNERTGDKPADSYEDWVTGLRQQQSLSREGLMEKGHLDNPGWHPDELGPWADAKFQMSEHALREILSTTGPGWQKQLRKIQCPILLVTGDVERGVIINPAMFQEAASLNPRVREAHIPKTGHCIHRDQFEPYIEMIQAFLEEVR